MTARSYTRNYTNLTDAIGSYGVTVPNDIKIDKMEIALDAADAEAKPLILSEIIIDGWSTDTEN